jgi:glycosyltransferase involved in cell wall biosynthesis
MKISVVITSYNQKDYLIQTIDSVLAQTFKPFEIFICDDCSTDDSRQVIRQYAKNYPDVIKPVFQTRNLGVTKNRNIGIKAATGDFITTLDGDDLYLPEKLEKEMGKAAKTKSQLVYSNVIYIDENGDKTGIRYKNNNQLEGCLFEKIATLRYPAPREVLIAKNCIDQLGFLDETLKINEDFEWIVRLSSRFVFSAVKEPLVLHRYHSGGLHRSNRLLLLETLAAVTEKLYGFSDSSIEKNKRKAKEKMGSFLNLSKARVEAFKGNHSTANHYLFKSLKQNPYRSSGYDLLVRLIFPKLFRRETRLPDSLMIGPLAIPFYLLRGVL